MDWDWSPGLLDVDIYKLNLHFTSSLTLLDPKP